MALTVTARGTGTHNASSTTFTLSPSGTLAAGSLAVLVVAADNAAASGVAFTTFAVSDDKANIWTRGPVPLYDPGAASEGVEGAQFTTNMAGGALTSASVITVTFDTATTAKAWVMWEVVPAAGKAVSYITHGWNTGAATTTPTVTTGSITSGDVMIGALYNEYGTAQTITQDGDSTNGAWSSQQTAEVGTTTAGMSVSSQYKITTGTATQTYNPTLGTSSDVILSWLQLRESPFLQVGAVDQTSFALLESMSLRFNTFDFALKNPATVPALGDAVGIGLPYWIGTVTSVRTTDLRLDYDLVTVTATNENVAAASAGPFGLSDAPNGTTTFGFQNMAVTLTTNLDASTETTGSCTIHHAGLWPAMTFPLTSANRGYSAQSFSVTNTTVTWPLLTNPVFRIEFGDPIVTMSVWVASQAANAPDGTISGTKITDGSVTTPKLAANSVTTAKISVGATGQANLVVNGSFEDADPSIGTQLAGWTTANITGDGAAVREVSVYARAGGARAVLSASSGAPNRVDIESSHFPVSESEKLAFSGWYTSTPATASGVYLRLYYYNTAGAFLSTTDFIGGGAGTGTWQQVKGYSTVPAGAVTAAAAIVNFQPATSCSMSFDDIRVTRMADGVKNSTAEVLIDAAGITVTNGAITVTNAGATVIIDGTSDMFRIAATGTFTVTGSNSPSGKTSTTGSATVSTGFTYIPMVLFAYEDGSSAYTMPRVDTVDSGTVAGMTSGGTIKNLIHARASVSGGTSTKVEAAWDTYYTNSSASTRTIRYYILEQAAF